MQQSRDKSSGELRLEKSPPGISGFDEITRGGLPRGRASLVTGGSGTGEYDLEGLFIRLSHAINTVGAKRLVLDTILQKRKEMEISRKAET